MSARTIRYASEKRLNIATGEYETLTPAELLAYDVMDWARAGRDRAEMKVILEAGDGTVGVVSVSVGASGFVSVRHWEDSATTAPLVFDTLNELDEQAVVDVFARVYSALPFVGEHQPLPAEQLFEPR